MAKVKAPAASGGEKVVTTNRKAFHDYHIEEELEAGIALTGTEIKSIRAGRVNLRDAYARIENGELWLIGMHISPYEHAGGYFQHDPDRPRKLLVHRHELNYLRNRVEAKGYTLVPLRLVLRKGLAKVDIGVARGKKSYDKRAALAERDARREMERALRQR
ncbi:SsrA-binding protein SmpB [Sphaerobacter thermophilus]|uniref:SsrA-binding protein n=1 Tax=Sphaerobacter thermophilus (strain ATCC 49802 / DSM 20745 / KCCM 41009 / NCIMB 13125 / S 6022) TaxID=479434 RepID=D1C2F1_SPHTD|nr:SsrA-binding protein SmpB [Sphaerobacter thermophilus]ACZ38418.1 SsrA-binding protein [Sphaerobacter thermophilus DSM 20745]